MNRYNPMDRLQAMAIFVAVAETGSLTAAGRRLSMPLPSVSRKLGELEAHLGTSLLTRSTRRLALTEAGHAYMAACKRILDDIDEAERTAAGEYATPKGELVIAAPIVFGRLHVLPIVCAFLASYPEIDVRLVLSDRNAELMDDHIDVAVRIGVLPVSSMIAISVGSVRRVVCGGPSYFAQNGIPRTPADIATLSCITFDTTGTAPSWAFGGGAREQTLPIQARLAVNTAEAALDAAIAGIGVTRVLSYQAEQGMRDGTLRTVLETFEPAAVPVSVIHPAQRQLPLKTRSFLDFIVPRLRQCLGDLATSQPVPLADIRNAADRTI